MRGRVFLVSIFACGCGIVSGLDGLGVVDGGDASADASTNADAAGVNDASDATSEVAGPSSIQCGQNAATCTTGQHCCVPTKGVTPEPTCTDDTATCPSGDVDLGCDDRGDCLPSQICCWTGTGAHCTLPTAQCAASLCNDASQCIDGKCEPFEAGIPLSLDRCQ